MKLWWRTYLREVRQRQHLWFTAANAAVAVLVGVMELAVQHDATRAMLMGLRQFILSYVIGMLVVVWVARTIDRTRAKRELQERLDRAL